jgi:hypothetical protein
MAELKYKPVRHEHAAFLAKAGQRAGFTEAYDAAGGCGAPYAFAGHAEKVRRSGGLRAAGPTGAAEICMTPASLLMAATSALQASFAFPSAR